MTFKDMENLRRQVHIDQLAKKLECTLIQKKNLPGMMYVEQGYVEGPVIENQIHYLTMLHELGHVANEHTQGRPGYSDKRWYFLNGVLRSEAEAWNWALDNIEEHIEIESRYFMWDYCLGSYYLGYLQAKGKPGQRLYNGNRHHVEFTYDEPDYEFRNTVLRIQGAMEGFKVQYKWGVHV